MLHKYVTVGAILILAALACRSRSDKRIENYEEKRESQADAKTAPSAPASTEATASRTTSKPAAVSADDKNFVEEASSAGSFEVESSRLALEKTQNQDHKEFAQKMIDDHSKANRELEQIALRKQIQLPSALDSKHSMLIDRLRGLSGPEFDREYHAIQLDAHKQTIGLFERAARECDDADLKGYAERTLPTLRAHLKHLETHEVPDIR